MDVLLLRLVHIAAGAFWVGAVFTNVLFIQRTAMALGPDAAKFQLHLIHDKRFPTWVLVSAATTVLAGLALLWLATDGFDAALLFAPARVGFTIGGVVAIVTFGVGSLYVFPRTERIAALMRSIAAAGRPPLPEEQGELLRTRGELLRAGWVVLAGVSLATVAMATARYWSVVL
jgi:uncharacterized membrane protein